FINNQKKMKSCSDFKNDFAMLQQEKAGHCNSEPVFLGNVSEQDGQGMPISSPKSHQGFLLSIM
ncbi:hypothetical protein ACLPHZ_19565, partial [Alcaligenaceae bacterium Me47]